MLAFTVSKKSFLSLAVLNLLALSSKYLSRIAWRVSLIDFSASPVVASAAPVATAPVVTSPVVASAAAPVVASVVSVAFVSSAPVVVFASTEVVVTSAATSPVLANALEIKSAPNKTAHIAILVFFIILKI